MSSKTKEQPPYYSAVVVIDAFGNVLLGKRREDGKFTTPAGGGELGELPIRTAIRELFEESGLVATEDSLRPLPSIETKNGKTCYCYLFEIQTLEVPITTSRLDPDSEVKTWKWYGKDQIPTALKDDENRFKSVLNGYMKFHGIYKSLMDKLEDRKHKDSCKIRDGSCDCIIQKGGSGSDQKGHTTLHQEEFQRKHPYASGYKIQSAGHTKDEAHSRASKINAKHGEASASIWHQDGPKTGPKSKYFLAHEDGLEKGGEGSGKVGHQTLHNNNVIHLTDKLQAMNKLEDHARKLTHGAIMEGVQLRDGKPLFLQMDQATAHGYTPKDHVEASNLHYDLAQKMADKIQMFKDAGKPVPDSMTEIKDFHIKRFKQHVKEADRLQNRAAKTDQAAKDMVQTDKDNKKVKKSVVMMGHNDGMEIDTAKFSAERANTSESSLSQRLFNTMDGYQPGDSPRVIGLDRGDLYLVSVGDGLYTGVFKKRQVVPDGELQDTAKVRIERMTIPSLVEFVMAHEWEKPQIAPLVNPSVPLPMPMVEDRTIRILELVNKLIG